jgi:histidine triad (HIT) family protein
MYNHEPDGYECFFCALAQGKETELNKQSDIIFNNGRVLALVSPRWWLNNPGNVLVIPRGHFENIYDIPDEVLAEVQQVGKKVALAMKESYGCDGVSFRQQNEPAGSQEAWHYHLHVFPRWSGDDLYINDNDSRYVTQEERQPYVEKFKGKM